MSLTESSVIDELKTLVLIIKETIEQGKREGKLIPDQRAYFRWKLNDFAYTDSGVQSSGAEGKEFVKDDWFRVFWAVHNLITKLQQYQNLENKLKSCFAEFKPHYLEMFVNHVIRSFLYDTVTPLFSDEVVTKFINELKGESFVIGAEVELDGIYLQSKSIKLGERNTLRQIQITDLETEYESNSYGKHSLYPTPSAILRIERLGREPFSVQRDVYRAITLLRLFRVASVVYYKDRMFTEAITSHGGGTGYSSQQDMSLNKSLIKENEVNELQKFWNNLVDKIPDTFIGFNTSDLSFRDIAYKRYEDALLHNGTIERRIANAMMGIEAIFLTEQSELSYRLRFRVAKIMGFFNEDPFKVKNKIRDAYDIRSNFVHGGLLSHSEKEKLVEKYESIDNLLKDILNYLRISIVIALLMPVGKDELLDTIDKSFLKKEFDNTLINYVRPVIQLIVHSNGN